MTFKPILFLDFLFLFISVLPLLFVILDLDDIDIIVFCTFVSKNGTIVLVNVSGLIGPYSEAIYAEVVNYLKELKKRNLYKYSELPDVPEKDQNVLASVFFL